MKSSGLEDRNTHMIFWNLVLKRRFRIKNLLWYIFVLKNRIQKIEFKNNNFGFKKLSWVFRIKKFLYLRNLVFKQCPPFRRPMIQLNCMTCSICRVRTVNCLVDEFNSVNGHIFETLFPKVCLRNIQFNVMGVWFPKIA